MKKLIPIFLLFAACFSLNVFSQDRIDTIPIVEGYYWIFRNDTLTGSYRDPPKRDTIPEWMWISTRHQGIVFCRKALCVRVNGICTAHLSCDGRLFKPPFIVGWCEGKDKLLTAFLNGRAKQ